MVKAFLLYLLIFLILFSSLFLSLYHYFDKIDLQLLRGIRTIIIFSNIVILTEIFYFFVLKNRKVEEKIKNIALTIYTLFLIFFVFEEIFMFVAQTHGVGYTLAHVNWTRRYWKPINSLGYRDKDFSTEDILKKKKIFVLGDSLAAGTAIKNSNDRFSNLLGKKLTPNYVVLNLGSGGAGTRSEFKKLVEFPFKPDILILQYYGNDIDEVAYSMEKWLSGFQPYQDLIKILQPLVKYSYFLNYLYWQFPHTETQPYINSLISAYNDQRVFKEHLSDLNKIVEFSKKNKIPLIVVIFPFLRDLETSQIFTIPIEKFLNEKETVVINVSNLIVNLPPAKRTVNSNDNHPNVLVNRLVAEELYQSLLKNKLITPNP
jgi:hypothetical protein